MSRTDLPLKNLNGKWIGFYNYEIDYIEKSVEFSIEFIGDNGDLTGSCIDSETQDIIKETIKVNGFFDLELQSISFIKTYPYEYYIDNLGNVTIDIESDEHCVEYTGDYDLVSDAFVGTWLIAADAKLFNEGKMDSIFSGTWQMKREKLTA